MTPQICAMHLGPNGIEVTRTGDALIAFQTKMRDAAFSDLAIELKTPAEIKREQAVALHTQAGLRKQLGRDRFRQWRDTSHLSKDIAEDPIRSRRLKGFSISRDMMEGPSRVGNVLNMSQGLNASTYGGADADRRRFIREADALRMESTIDAKDLPDWHDDAAIARFFGKVYDMALTEAKSGSPGFNRVIDTAPGIYLFTELLKRSEKMIEEDFAQMWARSIFPINNLNTWLPQWLYTRKDSRGVLPKYVNTNELPSDSPRGSENRAPVVRPLVFFAHGASWTNLELMQYAEAQANGAPNISLDQDRLDVARRMMLLKEDLLAFYGDKDVDLQGLFSPQGETEIERITGGPQFNAGTTEDDRQILTGTVKTIISKTERRLGPDTIMLPTDPWLYVTDERYGDVSNPSDQTVISAAEVSLKRMGVTNILWVPECGYSVAQEERLKDHGVPVAVSESLAGGIGAKTQEMVVCKLDASVMELIVAKDLTMYPGREQRGDRVEARMMQGSGAMAFYQPEAVKIVTNVGPV